MGYVVAIDLGTSKIVGMVAHKDGEGLSILAIEKESISSQIIRGYVNNVNELAFEIKRIIEKLEKKIKTPIRKIYVSINGQSLWADEFVMKYSMEREDTIITEDAVKKWKRSAQIETNSRISESLRNRLDKECEVLAIVSHEYFINKSKVHSPVGIPCSQIEYHYVLIAGKQALKRNIERSFKSIQSSKNAKNIEIAGYIASPLATAASVLSENDRELGCALIEFGAGVTSISVYKRKMLRYIATIPFGGDNITKDLYTHNQLNILERNAERFKKDGNCFPTDEDNGKIRLQTNDGSAAEVDGKKLNECISSRQNEIVANVLNQLKESGYSDEIAAIILAGGASRMNGLIELLQSKTNIPVRYSDILVPICESEIQPFPNGHYGYEQVIGMLWLGEANCAVKEIEKQVVKEPVAEKPLQNAAENDVNRVKTKKKDADARSSTGKITRFFGDLFGNISNDKSENLD